MSAGSCFRAAVPLWIAAGRHGGPGPDSRAAEDFFLAHGRDCGLAGAPRQQRVRETSGAGEDAGGAAGAPQARTPRRTALESLLKLDELSLEVGYALVPLVDVKQGGQLLQRIKALRRHWRCNLASSCRRFTSPTT